MSFSISNRIRELCDKNNITISTLERGLEFSAGLISRWDKNSPSIDKITQVADYFNVSVDSLIGRDTEDDSASIENQFINKLIDDTKKFKIQWKECEPYPTGIEEQVSEISGGGFAMANLLYGFESNILNVFLLKNYDYTYYLYTIVESEAFVISNDTKLLIELLEEIQMAMPRYKTRNIVVEKMKDYIKGDKTTSKSFTLNDIYESLLTYDTIKLED